MTYKTIRAQGEGCEGAAKVGVVALRCGESIALFAPKSGGALLAFSCKGFDVLRPAAADWNGDPLLSACFPLVPFSNRIREGRFELDGRIVALEPNWEGDEHTIHGIGWRQPWGVIERGVAHCVMAQLETEWWPWRYRAIQAATVAPGQLHLALSIENLSDSAMPAGLGFHPYLRRAANSQIQFKAACVRDNELARPEMTPVSGDFEFNSARPLGQVPLDHCYGGWAGAMAASYPDQGSAVHIEASSSAQCCVLFAPTEREFFCFEPATHMTGAFEADSPQAMGLRLLAPRQSLSLEMTISLHSLR